MEWERHRFIPSSCRGSEAIKVIVLAANGKNNTWVRSIMAGEMGTLPFIFPTFSSVQPVLSGTAGLPHGLRSINTEEKTQAEGMDGGSRQNLRGIPYSQYAP